MSTETGAVGSQREAAFGLDENIAAVVGYVVTIVFPALLLLKEDDNEFVRFHAAQSLVLAIVMFGAYVALTLVVTFVPALAMLSMLVWLAWLAATALLAYKAYGGEQFELPVVGGFAYGLV